MKLNSFKKGTIIISAVFIILAAAAFKSFAQTIETGDAVSGTVIENQVNTNIIKCCKPTPEPTREPTPTPTAGQQPTPTPTEKPGEGVPGPGGQGEPRAEGVGGQDAAAPVKEVLGLAATSGENRLADLLKILPAAVSFMLGYSFLRRA
jgi:hypothetical protein